MAKDKVSAEWGELLFTDADMQERLPKPTYKELRRVIDEGAPLDLGIANEVAHAMKEWALEKGATHFTHWFQPLNGITSEKHDSFLTPQGNGSILMAFSGKELVRGEPDASSFPNGGLRATFEARGYTVWDPMSPVFIKDEVLCIPTAFISYTGEALDKKTPLLRSQNALETQAKRVLALFGRTPRRVSTTIGPEQEYFLIKEEDYKARPDLILTGRTLFGCPPAKGQELEEHYFGAIRPTVSAFMKDLDDELWKLGVPAKTKHNEVAPCQHELAPVFESGSLAIDDNLLTMEKMRLIASRHGLTCLQHEKPFEYVNGSGKHNNWSISADDTNLLEPGPDPEHNLQFLVFLACLVAAVDEHADLLRMSVASAGNDHRLGANEAPPAVVSVFLGDALSPVVEALIHKEHADVASQEMMDLGIPQLPAILRDNTDRNRTSPFAFTGNKFEFRALGSSQSIAPINIALNAAVACALDDIAGELEAAVSAGTPLVKALQDFLPREFKARQAVIFNGNGYSAEWQKEAARRGLPNLATTVDALEHYSDPEVMNVFLRHGILSEREMLARQEILFETYAKDLIIEGRVLCDLVRAKVLPPSRLAQASACALAAQTRDAGLDPAGELAQARLLQGHVAGLEKLTAELEQTIAKVQEADGAPAQARLARDAILPLMDGIRAHADALERQVDDRLWELPKYSELLWTH